MAMGPSIFDLPAVPTYAADQRMNAMKSAALWLSSQNRNAPLPIG
jgi:hypothetical protein